jgi:sialate O-acetylesterase
MGDANPIAYYFARELSRNTEVMTAVVRIAWGGRHIEEFYQGAYIYQHMFEPWSRMKVKGVIWYQGENNLYKDGDRLGYALKLQLLIRDYRRLWNNPALPFLIVQLPPSTYSSRPFNDLESLPVFLEAQRQVLQIPFTSMAVASDLGMSNGLHQPQKYELSIRLANLALANVYHDPEAVPAGPQFERIKIEGNRVIVSFETFGSELTTSDGQMPQYFEIAAKKQEFKPAQVKIEGSTLVLWNDEIEKPYDIRYGFDEKVLMKLNLTNTEGIPAAVFWARAQNQLHPGLLNEMKKQVD